MTYANVVNVKVVVFFGALDPFDNVGYSSVGIIVRISRAFANPAGKTPRKSVELNIGIPLKRQEKMI